MFWCLRDHVAARLEGAASSRSCARVKECCVSTTAWPTSVLEAKREGVLVVALAQRLPVAQLELLHLAPMLQRHGDGGVVAALDLHRRRRARKRREARFAPEPRGFAVWNPARRGGTPRPFHSFSPGKPPSGKSTAGGQCANPW